MRWQWWWWVVWCLQTKGVTLSSVLYRGEEGCMALCLRLFDVNGHNRQLTFCVLERNNVDNNVRTRPLEHVLSNQREPRC